MSSTDASVQSELERSLGAARSPSSRTPTRQDDPYRLLRTGAIELAGAVRGRKDRKAATSDWMELEQQRGISITSAALEFEL